MNPVRQTGDPSAAQGLYWTLPLPFRDRMPGSRTHANRTLSESYRGLSKPAGVHLNFALGLSNEVGPPQAQRSHPNHPKPEVVARAPNEVWSWDITRLLGPGEVAVLLSVRDPGHLQPLRHRMDGGGARDRRPGRTPGWRDVSQARCRAPGAHAALGPGSSHDGQVHGAALGRPRCHAVAGPPLAIITDLYREG